MVGFLLSLWPLPVCCVQWRFSAVQIFCPRDDQTAAVALVCKKGGDAVRQHLWLLSSVEVVKGTWRHCEAQASVMHLSLSIEEQCVDQFGL